MVNTEIPFYFIDDAYLALMALSKPYINSTYLQLHSVSTGLT